VEMLEVGPSCSAFEMQMASYTTARSLMALLWRRSVSGGILSCTTPHTSKPSEAVYQFVASKLPHDGHGARDIYTCFVGGPHGHHRYLAPNRRSRVAHGGVGGGSVLR
jgi:hypothetical protein